MTPKPETLLCPNCGQEISAPGAEDPIVRCEHCKERLCARSSSDGMVAIQVYHMDDSTGSFAAVKPEQTGNESETITLIPTIPSDQEAAKPKDIAGRYKLNRLLGEGAFGRVYEAYDQALDRLVALKVAKTHRNDERIKRFLREAKATAGLRHPHIVPLYEYGQDGDSFFIASAYIKGKTLLEDMESRVGTPDLKRSVRIVRQLGEALAHAHSKGIVHRDVKPANAMLDERDEPLLMDFGLATRAAEEEKLTHAGQIMGTPLYMSPEQARGGEEGGLPATDQYSLGVVLYQMITGKPIFDGSAHLVMFHHLETTPTSPRSHNPRISRDLDAICMKCLEKKPESRYENVQMLVDDLSRWEKGEFTRARPASLARKVGRWVHSLSVVWLLLIGALIVAPFAWWRLNDYWRENQEKQLAFKVHRHKFGSEEAAPRKDEAPPRKEPAIVVQNAFFIADGRLLVNKGRYGVETGEGIAELWNLKRRKLEFRESAPKNPFRKFASASDHPVVASANDRDFFIWNFATGKHSGKLKGHVSFIKQVAVSRDGKLAATASDQSVRFWDVESLRCAEPLLLPSDVHDIAFSPNGHFLAGSFESQTHVWDTRFLSKPIMLPGKPLGFSADGSLFVTSNAAETFVWQGQRFVKQAVLRGHKDRIFSIAFSSNSEIIATSSVDRTVRLWDAKAGKELHCFTDADSFLRKVYFSPEDKTLLGHDERQMFIWDVTSGDLVFSFDLTSVKGTIMAGFEHIGPKAMPNRRQVVFNVTTSGTSRNVNLRTFGIGAEKGQLIASVPSVGPTAISPDGSWMFHFASGSPLLKLMAINPRNEGQDFVISDHP